MIKKLRDYLSNTGISGARNTSRTVGDGLAGERIKTRTGLLYEA
jgi:hypothetical protein